MITGTRNDRNLLDYILQYCILIPVIVNVYKTLLLQAIIYIMLEHPGKKAMNCWEKFIDIRISFQSPSSHQSQLNEAVTNFNEFEKAVKLLRNDILEAHGKQIKP